MKLVRDFQSDVCTLGAIFMDDGERLCETLELPWRNNERGVSCIPEGVYFCQYAYSPARKRKVYWVRNVPGREAVQIHIGNFPKDIRGCILVGRERAQDQVVHSKVAFDKLIQKMGAQDFMLTIVRQLATGKREE